MSAESFEKTSWGWQLSQLQRQIGEWWEYQISRWRLPFSDRLPEWSILPWVENLLKFLFWMLLGLFFTWVIWRLWQEFRSYIYSRLNRINDTAAVATFQSKNVSAAAWLERSQDFYRQGKYGDACRCLYLATLQYLHETKIIPQKASRTDGEYLQLLQLSGTPIQPYETLITTHEQLCFSDRKVSSETYQQCQQAYGEITSNK